MSSAPESPSAAAPRSLHALTRALRLGQHTLFAVLLLVAWARAAGERPWFEVVAAALGLLYAAVAAAEPRPPTPPPPTPAPPTPPPPTAGVDVNAPGIRRRAYIEPGAAVGRRGALAVGLLALLLIAWAGSVTLTPDFAWLAFPLFFAVLRLLPAAAALPIIAAMVLVVVWGHARVTGWSDVGLATVIGPTVGALVSIGMAHAYRMLLRENAARQQLVEDLTAAKADLEATHEALAESRREAGAIEERARLSRDLHDTLAQGLSSIVLLGRAAHRPGADTADLLGRIEEQAAVSLGEARAVIADLAPDSLRGSSLPAALERLVASVTELSGIRATFDAEGADLPLPRAHEVALLRLAQGALANVTLHSRASRVAVSLSVGDDGTQLDIVDDGVGFDPDVIRVREDGTGYGLRSMRERMAALGGELAIESAPGSGTAVAAHLPGAPA